MPPGIEQRGSVWRARVRRDGHRVSATFDSSAEAEAWRASTIAALVRGEVPSAAPRLVPAPVVLEAISVEQAAREWVLGALRGSVRTSTGGRYRAETIRTFEYRLRCWVLPFLGRLPVTTLSRGIVRRWLEELTGQVSSPTARSAMAALRTVLRRLVDQEIIPSNRCLGVRSPSREPVRQIRFLSPEEGAILRVAAAAEGIGPFVDLALATGARHGELRALRWGPEGLDLEARQVAIAATWSQHFHKTGPPKGGRPRVVPIGAGVATRLREYRMAQGRPVDGALVFPTGLNHRWERARRSVPEPYPTVHGLRHTAACWWLGAGLTAHAVGELLGHADAQMVLRLYGHALPAERSTAGERMEAFLAATGT